MNGNREVDLYKRITRMIASEAPQLAEDQTDVCLKILSVVTNVLAVSVLSAADYTYTHQIDINNPRSHKQVLDSILIAAIKDLQMVCDAHREMKDSPKEVVDMFLARMKR